MSQDIIESQLGTTNDQSGERTGRGTSHDHSIVRDHHGSTDMTNNQTYSPKDYTLEIRPKTVMKFLGFCIFVVVSLHMMVMVAWFGFGHDELKGVARIFNMSEEQNLPTYYSCFQIIIAAILLGCCAYECKIDQGKYYKHWFWLCIIFIYLSLDEFIRLHETTSNVTIALFRDYLGIDGMIRDAWIIPFGILCMVGIVVYSGFLLSLPRRISFIFVLSGVIFVSGAIGLEILESLVFVAKGGNRTFEYMSLVTIEETMEMIGICVFIFGLMSYLTFENRRGLNVSLRS